MSSMIPRESVAALAAALSQVLYLPVPAATVTDQVAYRAEREIRVAHVRAWAEAFVSTRRLSVGEFTSALCGLAEQRSLLPYAPQAERTYLDGRLAEQRHQLLDPPVPAPLHAAVGGAL